MPDETAPPAPNKPIEPVCPYCGLDPCVPDMLDGTFGTILVKLFICPNRACRKLFNVSTVGRKQSGIVGAAGQPV